MPRLGCDTRIEKPSVDIADRVSDLRNRVAWLKNVEFCLFGDQTDRLNEVKRERYAVEVSNHDLQLALPSGKVFSLRKASDGCCKGGIDDVKNQRHRAVNEHNRLLFIHQTLLDRLESLRRHTRRSDKLVPTNSSQIESTKTVTRRIRELQDRLTSVKLINRTLHNCKHYLQCDLDLLRKELPSVQRDIGQKFDQRMILKKEFLDIVAENKRRLVIYQQLLDHTEAQTRQRRTIHEQAMASVAEQLEDQYQVQMMAVNEMSTSLESRKLAGSSGSNANVPSKSLNLMSSDEIVQVRCMYDQFYNLIMAGFPIDVANSEQLKTMVDDVSSKSVSLIGLTKRMMEEKDQLNQQRNRTEQLRQFIDMSMNLKNETRRRILDEMVEQRQHLELFYTNDTVEVQNRILRQINDFLLVLSKAVCEHVTTSLVLEPSIDLIERLHFIFDLVSKAMKTRLVEPIDDDGRQFSPVRRRSGAEVNSTYATPRNSQSRLIDRSINSSVSSLSSRPRRNSIKHTIY